MKNLGEYRIVWTPIPEPAAAKVLLEATSIWDRTASLAISEVGVPTVEGAATPKEDAMGLLQLAAEIEHALLVQYLYAAASVDISGGSDSVHARSTIMSVAIQEMGHLVTVQNLLLAVAGRSGYHLGRDRLRAKSDRNPLPFVLEPVSHSALAKFVTIERPDLAQITDPSLLERVTKLGSEAAQATGTTPHPVAALYTALYWLFQPTDAPAGRFPIQDPPLKPGWHLSPADFLAVSDIDQYATSAGEWGGFPGLIVEPVHNSAEALDALFNIMAQGEGSPGTMGPSHFSSFLTVLDAFEAQRIRVIDMPRTPRVNDQPPSEDEHSTTITDQYAVLWGRLFNIRYSHLVLCIGHALFLKIQDTDRQQLVGFALTVMHGLNKITRELLRLNIGQGYSKAGPTFGLLNDILPSEEADFWAHHRTFVNDQAAITAMISARIEFQTDVSGQLVLQQFTTDDQALQQILAGHPTT